MAPSQKKSKDTYCVTVSCSNCGYHGSMSIARGTTVNASRCPHCGCQTIGLQFKNRPEPSMKFKDIWNDSVDRALRPKEFPWLNTFYSMLKKRDFNELEMRYVDDNGDRDFKVFLDGEPVEVSGKPIDIKSLFGD